MKNNSAVLLLSLVCAFSTGIMAADAAQDEFENLMNSKCTVISTTTDLPEGEKLTAQSLGEQSISYRDVPIDAITAIQQVDGLTAKYGIVQGGIVCTHTVNDSATKESNAAQEQTCALIAAALKAIEQKSNDKAKLSEFEQSILAQKGIVLYAIKDVAEGSEITSEAVEERPMVRCKIPQDALMSAQLIANKTAKYKLSAGQVVSQHDLAFKAP